VDFIRIRDKASDDITDHENFCDLETVHVEFNSAVSSHFTSTPNYRDSIYANQTTGIAEIRLNE